MHHVTCLLNHRVAGVPVGDRKDDAALFDGLDQALCLLQGVDHRLVEHDVEAGLDEGVGYLEVHVVGRHDADKVDALFLGQGQLALQHLLPASVITVVGELPITPGGERLLLARRECPGDELDLAVHERSTAVYCADQGVAAPADHAHLELTHATPFRMLRKAASLTKEAVRSATNSTSASFPRWLLIRRTTPLMGGP